jgi:hypothetical protein
MLLPERIKSKDGQLLVRLAGVALRKKTEATPLNLKYQLSILAQLIYINFCVKLNTIPVF